MRQEGNVNKEEGLAQPVKACEYGDEITVVECFV